MGTYVIKSKSNQSGYIVWKTNWDIKSFIACFISPSITNSSLLLVILLSFQQQMYYAFLKQVCTSDGKNPLL